MSKSNLELAISFQPNQVIITIDAVCVPHDEEIVGVGRVIGDGGLFYDIVDMAVAAEHQQKGVGKLILACRQWQARNANSWRGRIQRIERRAGA